MSRVVWLRLGLFVGLIGVLAAAALLTDAPTMSQVHGWTDAAGWAGVFVFVLVYVAFALIPVPKAVLTLAAGALYGVPLGAALALVGATTGAGLAFGAARLLGRDGVTRLEGRRLAWLDDVLARRGFLTVLGLRLVPLVPYTVLNYGAGLTGVRWRSYLLATILGMSPGATLYATLGAHSDEPASWPFVLAGAGLAALTVLTAAVSWRRRRRGTTSRAAVGPGDSE